VHDIKIITEEIGLPIKKLSENTSLYPIINQLKSEKFYLLDLKSKTMSSYCDTMSYNSSPDGRGSVTSLLTLPTKTIGGNKKCFAVIC
jgi:hypothetical protein